MSKIPEQRRPRDDSNGLKLVRMPKAGDGTTIYILENPSGLSKEEVRQAVRLRKYTDPSEELFGSGLFHEMQADLRQMKRQDLKLTPWYAEFERWMREPHTALRLVEGQ